MSDYQGPQEQSFLAKYKWYIIAIVGVILFRAIGSNSDSAAPAAAAEYEETTVATPTEGVITKLQEVEPDVFKITDEEVVPTLAESRIIADYMDGAKDTFTVNEIAVVDTTVTSDDNNYRRRSGISRVVHYGLIGYMLGRPMGSPMRSSSYANRQSYTKSQAGRTRVASSATSRTVRTPRTTSSSGKSGFGSGKSTKSYGG